MFSAISAGLKLAGIDWRGPGATRVKLTLYGFQPVFGIARFFSDSDPRGCFSQWEPLSKDAAASCVVLGSPWGISVRRLRD